MIKFFRRIRQQLLNENKTRKYLKYAVGEIVLVVIGILIALQINNWNNQNLLHKKELNYLVEIRENLNEDLKKIEVVFEYNTKKAGAINEAFTLMGSSIETNVRVDSFGELMPTLTSYQFFSPIRISFDNMISSQSIDLISDNKLRKLLSEYYSVDFNGGTQERIKTQTRKFVDDVIPLLFNKQVIDRLLSINSQLPDIESLNFHTSPIVFGDLFGMLKNIEAQNELLLNAKSNINGLLEIINGILINDRP
ncbi:MAG: hypothetical protein IMY67_04175 [Bacteroidetes bacterium]|nr:hypothetical protein [Bacteroidota bacterium]